MKKIGKKEKASVISLLAVIIASFVTLIFSRSTQINKNLRVFFVDVGQGDCSVINIDGYSFLLDGGEEECWKQDIKPFMRDNGIKQFSDVMLSHYHSDHGGGIYELIKSGKGERILIPDTADNGEFKDRLVSLAKKRQMDVLPVTAGAHIDSPNQEIEFEVLFPDAGIYKNKDKNLNNDSIVLKLSYYGTTFLFMGDIEEDAEMVLLNSGKLDADVLKVGHHGSKTSTSLKFLKAVSPGYAVISVGENNRYGHPHENVVKRLKENKTMIYRTDQKGDIMFEVNKEGILKIETEY